MSEDKTRVAFVCLGNICRSPMAEAVFSHVLSQKGLSEKFAVESFGTSGWHVGEDPDSRTIRTCRHHGVPINHLAQQFSAKDFKHFDYVLGMDESNRSDLMRMRPGNSSAKVFLFGEFSGGSKSEKIINDPYYGGVGGFETCFQQCMAFSESFLEHLDKKSLF